MQCRQKLVMMTTTALLRLPRCFFDRFSPKNISDAFPTDLVIFLTRLRVCHTRHSHGNVGILTDITNTDNGFYYGNFGGNSNRLDGAFLSPYFTHCQMPLLGSSSSSQKREGLFHPNVSIIVSINFLVNKMCYHSLC